MDKLNEGQIQTLKDEGYTLLGTEFRIQPSGFQILYMNLRHELCGKEYSAAKDKFFRVGQRCTCQRKMNDEKKNRFMKVLNEKSFELVGNLISDKKPVTIKCKICGTVKELHRAENLEDYFSCEVCHPKADRLRTMNSYFKENNINLVALETDFSLVIL